MFLGICHCPVAEPGDGARWTFGLTFLGWFYGSKNGAKGFQKASFCRWRLCSVIDILITFFLQYFTVPLCRLHSIREHFGMRSCWSQSAPMVCLMSPLISYHLPEALSCSPAFSVQYYFFLFICRCCIFWKHIYLFPPFVTKGEDGYDFSRFSILTAWMLSAWRYWNGGLVPQLKVSRASEPSHLHQTEVTWTGWDHRAHAANSLNIWTVLEQNLTRMCD